MQSDFFSTDKINVQEFDCLCIVMEIGRIKLFTLLSLVNLWIEVPLKVRSVRGSMRISADTLIQLGAAIMQLKTRLVLLLESGCDCRALLS